MSPNWKPRFLQYAESTMHMNSVALITNKDMYLYLYSAWYMNMQWMIAAVYRQRSQDLNYEIGAKNGWKVTRVV